MIKIENLTKSFGNTLAVDNLNLTIAEGEFFTFLGPNGAGKTTTLKTITGLLRPTSGKVYVGNFDMSQNAREAKRIISYIPDIPYLYDKLTGREFLYFIGELYELDKKGYRQKTEGFLALFNMEDYADHLIETYSHGMRQKLIISSALLPDPRVIIIDEPMVGLDPKSMRLVKDILSRRAEEKTTIVMSTHTLTLAEEISHRIGIIHKGRLICLGTVQEIKDQAQESEKLEDIFLKMTEEDL